MAPVHFFSVKKKEKRGKLHKATIITVMFFFLHHFSQGLFIIGGKTKKKDETNMK